MHLYRDGRACAYSMSHHAGFRLAAVTTMLQSRLGMSPYVSDDQPRGQVPPDMRPVIPETLDHQAFERFEVPVAEAGRLWPDMITATRG